MKKKAYRSGVVGLKIALLFARLGGHLLAALRICNTVNPSPILFAAGLGPQQLTMQTQLVPSC